MWGGLQDTRKQATACGSAKSATRAKTFKIGAEEARVSESSQYVVRVRILRIDRLYRAGVDME